MSKVELLQLMECIFLYEMSLFSWLIIKHLLYHAKHVQYYNLLITFMLTLVIILWRWGLYNSYGKLHTVSFSIFCSMVFKSHWLLCCCCCDSLVNYLVSVMMLRTYLQRLKAGLHLGMDQSVRIRPCARYWMNDLLDAQYYNSHLLCRVLKFASC